MGSRAYYAASCVMLCIALVACAHVPKRTPLPAEDADLAQVPGLAGVRYWGDEPAPWAQWLDENVPDLRARFPGVYGRPLTILAISGGGADGAFGAGLLTGWTERGDRPEFSIVTGISAGALIAPFAFLGPRYDHVLRQVTRDLKASDVYEERRTLEGLRSDAMASTEPLRQLIAELVDQELVDKVAEQHRRGRTLTIGTANLDSMRPVVWNITMIAGSGHPRALELIRQIMLASASIPAAFPPVLIDVEANGQVYDELHVDGGATSQVYVYPIGVDFHAVAERLAAPGRPTVYIIRNAKLAPNHEAVPPKVLSIARRSVSSLVRTQGIGDLFLIYLQCLRDGLDYNLAYLPPEFDVPRQSEFDPNYVRAVFSYAFEAGKQGYPWRKVPPGLESAPMRLLEPTGDTNGGFPTELHVPACAASSTGCSRPAASASDTLPRGTRAMPKCCWAASAPNGARVVSAGLYPAVIG